MSYVLTGIASKVWTDWSDYTGLGALSARLRCHITGDSGDYMAVRSSHPFGVVTWGCGWISPWWPLPPLKTWPKLSELGVTVFHVFMFRAFWKSGTGILVAFCWEELLGNYHVLSELWLKLPLSSFWTMNFTFNFKKGRLWPGIWAHMQGRSHGSKLLWAKDALNLGVSTSM